MSTGSTFAEGAPHNVGRVLAELLDDPRQLGDPVDSEVLASAHACLEDAAHRAVELAGWTSNHPLRLSKGPIGWLLRCPRRAVAPIAAVEGTGNPDDLAIGLVVDAGAKLAALGPSQPVDVDAALAFLAATGDETVAPYLDDIGADAAAALREEISQRLARLMSAWPKLPGAWWPRVEEPVRIRLAGGAITLGGKLDLLLGGPPTAHPGLIVEVKSGRWHDEVRRDGHLYGLLVGLRDGVAPAAVLTIAAAEGETQLEPIRPVVVAHTAERIAVALDTAAHLVAGEEPAAYPGPHCAFCPLRDECPEAAAAAA